MLNILESQLLRGALNIARSKVRPPLALTSRSPAEPSQRSPDDVQARRKGTLATVIGPPALKRGEKAPVKKSTAMKGSPPKMASVPEVHSKQASQASGKRSGALAPPAPESVGLMPTDLSPKEVEAYLRAKPFDEIPGPTGIHQSIPFAGTRLLFYPFSSVRVDNSGCLLNELQATYGPILRMKVGAEWVVLIDNLADVGRLIKASKLEEERGCKKLQKSQLGGILEKLPKRIEDPSLNFVLGGESIPQKVREAINKQVKNESVATQILKGQEQVAQDLMTALLPIIDSPQEVQNLFYRYAYESMCQTCFGQRLGLLNDSYQGDEQKQKLVESYRTVDQCLSENMSGLRVLHMLFEDPFAKRFKEAKETCISTEQLLLNEVRAGKDSSGKGLLANLLNDKSLSEKEITDTMHAMVTACGDGVSACLQMQLYSLATNVEKQEKLVQELHKALGPECALTPSTLSNAKFLEAVLLESLRLNFPIPSGGQVVLNSNIVIGNYLIPAGTPIIINAQRISKNPELFDHPHSFLPERWLEPRSQELPLLTYTSISLQKNLGQFLISRNAINAALVKIINKFKLDLPGNYHNSPLETVYTPFLAPMEPLPLSFTERGQQQQQGGQKQKIPLEPPK